MRLLPSVSDRDHFQGSLGAPVILVEFGDYQCPDCKAAFPVVKALQAELGDRLCLVYRHFPLTDIHPDAQGAAEAAEAADAQGAFWKMHDTLFRNSPALGLAQLVAYTAELGLDARRLSRDLRSHMYLPRVQEDIASGRRSDIRGTPTFFINGARHHGGASLANMLEALRIAR